MDLLPASLSLLDACILIATAGFTSLLTGAMGIGGGVLLLAIMAGIVPAAALIPVHGLVQLGSNGNRALMTRRHIDWGLLKRFALGALAGALLASLIVVQLPLQWIQFSVAAFILYLVWGPKPAQRSLGAAGQVLAGGFTTLVSMFVGATGPLVAGFIHRHDMDKLATTATFAGCMSVQHLLKMSVFTAVGFAFWELAAAGGGDDPRRHPGQLAGPQAARPHAGGAVQAGVPLGGDPAGAASALAGRRVSECAGPAMLEGDTFCGRTAMTQPRVAQRSPCAVEVEAGCEYWWCRCGLSRSQPFCDGSHRGTPFTPLRYRPLRSETLYFCACKHTATPPLCDGGHKLV